MLSSHIFLVLRSGCFTRHSPILSSPTRPTTLITFLPNYTTCINHNVPHARSCSLRFISLTNKVVVISNWVTSFYVYIIIRVRWNDKISRLTHESFCLQQPVSSPLWGGYVTTTQSKLSLSYCAWLVIRQQRVSQHGTRHHTEYI